ncbi:UNVERIFIED_CONTAM: hypothetical protein Cloal_1738 [Acetivibrio alkalicellulosi]
MNRIRLKGILVLLVILLNIFSVKVFSTQSTDIIISNYSQSVATVNNNNPFEFSMVIENSSGHSLEDVFMSVDRSSAFYIVQNQPQVIALDNLKIGKSQQVRFNLVYKGSGNELTLSFNYNKDEQSYQTQHTVYLNASERREPSSAGTQIDTSKLRPNFVVNDKVKTKQGESGNLLVEIPIKNSSSHSARDITITMAADSADFPFMANSSNLTIQLDELKANEEKKVILDLIVKPNTRTDTYPLKLEFRYNNLHRDYFTSMENVFIKVENNEKTPVLSLKDIKFDVETPSAGEKFKASFEFENRGTLEAKDIKVTLKGFNEKGIIPEFTGVKYINSIQGGKTGKVDYNLIVSNDIGVENYPLEVVIEYEDEYRDSYTVSYTHYVSIMLKEVQKSSVRVDNITSPKSKILPEKDFNIDFDIINDGPSKVSNVKVTLSSGSEIINKSQSIIMIETLQPDEARRIQHILYPVSDAATKNYPIEISIEYKDGEEMQRITRYVGVFVENNKSDETNSSIPRLIIDRYSVSTGQAVAGQSFDIDIGILNTHKNITVSNIGVSFLGEEGVFIPSAGSGSTIFISEIKPGTRTERTLSFDTKFSAEPKSYLLNVSFEYEDENQRQHTLKESISISVVQEHKLEMSDIEITSNVQIGQRIPIKLDFYNMGRSTLYNMMVKCVGDFDIIDGNYFAGNFNSGRSDYYEATIIPTKEGQIKGAVVFTFEDSMGNKVEEQKEFELSVDEARDMGDMYDFHEGMIEHEFTMPGSGLNMKAILLMLLIIPVVITAIIVTVVIIVRKRKKASADLYENF